MSHAAALSQELPELAELRADFIDRFRPQGSAEIALLNEVILATWQLRDLESAREASALGCHRERTLQHLKDMQDQRRQRNVLSFPPRRPARSGIGNVFSMGHPADSVDIQPPMPKAA